MFVKLIVFLRSAVIDMDDHMTSICFEVREGMMPSHATSTSSHFSFICLQTASMRSISQPTHLPDASFEVKGGYGSAATPNLISALACAPNPSIASAAVAIKSRRETLIYFLPNAPAFEAG